MKKQELINLKRGDIVMHSEWFECKVQKKFDGHSVNLKPTDKLYVKLIKMKPVSFADGSFNEYDWQNKIKIKK